MKLKNMKFLKRFFAVALVLVMTIGLTYTGMNKPAETVEAVGDYYTEVSFGDYNFRDGKYSDATYNDGTLTEWSETAAGLVGYDNIMQSGLLAFSGKIKFGYSTEEAAWNKIGIGGLTNPWTGITMFYDVNGDLLYFQSFLDGSGTILWAFTGTKSVADSWDSGVQGFEVSYVEGGIKDQLLDIRIEIEHYGADADTYLYVNDVQADAYIEDAGPGIGGLMLVSSYNSAHEIYSTDIDATEFEELTVADIGLVGTYTNEAGFYAKSEEGRTLENTAVTGTYTFTADGQCVYFGSTSWQGFRIGASGENIGVYFVNGAGVHATMNCSLIKPSHVGFTDGTTSFLNRPTDIRISFSSFDSNGVIRVGVHFLETGFARYFNIANYTTTDGADSNITMADFAKGVFIVNATASPMTIETDYVDPNAYDLMTMTAFSQYTGAVSGAKTEQGYSVTGGTFDNYAMEFNMKIANSANSGGWPFLTLVGLGAGYQGFQMSYYNGAAGNYLEFRFVDADGTVTNLGQMLASSLGGIDLSAASYHYRVTFDVTNSNGTTGDLRVGVQVDKGSKRYFTIDGITLSTLARGMVVPATATYQYSFSAVDQSVVTLANFGVTSPVTVGTSGYWASGSKADNDRVSLEGFYQFSVADESNQVIHGSGWNGVRIIPNENGDLTFTYYNGDSSQKMGTITSKQVGDSLVGSPIKMKLIYNYENISGTTADVIVGVVINDNYRTALRIENASTTAFTNDMTVHVGHAELPIILSNHAFLGTGMIEVTPSDFGVADGTYAYKANDISAGGEITNQYTSSSSDVTMVGKVFSADVQFTGTGGSIIVGGNDNVWAGLKFTAASTTAFTMTRTETTSSLADTTFTAAIAGLASTQVAFNLKISFEPVDCDGDGRDDVRLGVWFNDTLYNDQYIYCTNDASYYGEGMSVLVATSGSKVKIASGERELSQNVIPYIMEDFGVTPQTYTSDYQKTMSYDLTASAITGKMALASGAYVYLYGPASSAAKGLRFSVSGSTLTVAMQNSGATAVKATFSGISANSTFKFLVSEEIFDGDNDGTKDDVRFGIWVNDTLFGNKYFYLNDYASQVSATVLIKGASGAVDVDSSAEVEYYNIADADNGFLVVGKGSITVNGTATASGSIINTTGDYTIRNSGEGSYVKRVAIYAAGDAHGDGIMDSKDVMAAKKALAGLELATLSGAEGVDADADGVLEAADFTAIFNSVLRTEASYDIAPVQNNYLEYEKDVMPLAGFYGPYKQTVAANSTYGFAEETFDYLNDTIYGYIADAGINLITHSPMNYDAVTQREDIEKNLALAEKYNIDMYVEDTRLRGDYTDESGTKLTDSTLDQYPTFLEDFAEYSSFKGIMIVDEPYSRSFGNYRVDQWGETGTVAFHKDRAAKANSYLNTIGYVNLLPMTHNVDTAQFANDAAVVTPFTNYVNNYVNTYNARQISTDYYVYSYGSDTYYYKSLDIMRSEAKKANIPFWCYVQCGKGWSAYQAASVTITQPNQGELLWNVNTSLAFGAKGISYFPLIQPWEFARNNDGTYDYAVNGTRNGVIAVNGTKTKWHGYVKNANAWVTAVDEVLMNSEFITLLASGNAATTSGYSSKAYGAVTNVTTDGSASASGALVGVFKYKNKTAYYVVNNSKTATQGAYLHFDKTRTLTLYSTVNGMKASWASTTYGESLAPGAAYLVIVEN